MRHPVMWPAVLVAISCVWNSAMAEQKKAVEVGVLVCSLFESGRAKTGADVEAQEHDILCSFKLNTGAEETYTGKLLGAGLSGEHKGTLLWLVEAPPTV